MKRCRQAPTIIFRVLIVAAVSAFSSTARADSPKVDFNRDIRPILSNNCFKCHGPDEKERQAGLRLDKQEGAVAELPSGAKAITPGQPAASSLIERITSADADAKMPPPDSG